MVWSYICGCSGQPQNIIYFQIYQFVYPFYSTKNISFIVFLFQFICTEKDEETERRKYLDNLSIKNACVENGEDLQFSVGNLGKQNKITFEAKNEVRFSINTHFS